MQIGDRVKIINVEKRKSNQEKVGKAAFIKFSFHIMLNTNYAQRCFLINLSYPFILQI